MYEIEKLVNKYDETKKYLDTLETKIDDYFEKSIDWDSLTTVENVSKARKFLERMPHCVSKALLIRKIFIKETEIFQKTLKHATRS